MARCPNVSPAICSRPASASTCLNQQSALWRTQHRFKRSEPEPRWPRSGRRIGHRSSRRRAFRAASLGRGH
eukprot:15429336-Alexandrium_andersonii.AAC.1